jgi:hypothetical protein
MLFLTTGTQYRRSKKVILQIFIILNGTLIQRLMKIANHLSGNMMSLKAMKMVK